MTKKEKIEILKQHCNFKPDIYQALELLNCKVGVEIGVRIGNNFKNLLIHYFTEDCVGEYKNQFRTLASSNYHNKAARLKKMSRVV